MIKILKKKIKVLLKAILYLAFDFIYLFPRKKKKILFVVPNVLIFAYFKLLFEKLKNEQNMHISFCFDKDIPNNLIKKMTAELEPESRVHVVSYRFAMLFRWSLIFFADITQAHKSFNVKSKKIRIEHGLQSGKIDKNGDDVLYSKGLLNNNGEIAYDAIFSSSKRILLESIDEKLPGFTDKAKLTGCLRMDSLLEKNKLRNKIRKNLKVPANKKVVFITSSWGDDSLIARCGTEFYNNLTKLSKTYHFVVTVHPHNYKKLHHRGTVTDNTFKQLKIAGGIVLAPEEDWVPFLACSDLLVTDHTSLSLYFVALKRPIICLKLPFGLGVENAEMYRMQNISISISGEKELKEALEVALSSKVSREHLFLAEDICSNQGEAWKYIRSEVHKVLEKNN